VLGAILWRRMLEPPAVRASAVRDTLAFLDIFEAGSQAEVMRRVPQDSRAIIEDTPRSAWIPVEHDHHTIDAIIDVFGLQRAIECWTGALLHLTKRPLLSSFISGMTRLFGKDPIRVISLLPKGWNLVYRGVCVPVLARGDRPEPVIRFVQVAPEIRRYSNYFHSWHGGCRAFASLASMPGKVSFSIAPDMSYAEAAFKLK
jgi:hypothetical protein